jgi:hypothetical protein
MTQHEHYTTHHAATAVGASVYQVYALFSHFNNARSSG